MTMFLVIYLSGSTMLTVILSFFSCRQVFDGLVANSNSTEITGADKAEDVDDVAATDADTSKNSRSLSYIDYFSDAWKQVSSMKRAAGGAKKRNLRLEKKNRIAATAVVLKSLTDSRNHLLEPQTQSQCQSDNSSSRGSRQHRDPLTWKDVLDTVQRAALHCDSLEVG